MFGQMITSSKIQPALLIPALSAANFVIGMGAFMVVGLLNPLADDLVISTTLAGWVMTSYALAYAVLSPLLVSLSGKIGRRRVLVAGLSIFAFGCTLCATAPNPAILFGGRVIAAAGAGMFTPVAAAVAAGLSDPEGRAKALATVFFGMTLAQVLGVPAGGFIAYTFGWRSAFTLVALLALPFIWLVWTRVPKGLRFQPVTLADLGKVLRDGPIMLAILFTSSFLCAIYIVFTYLSPLLTETMGFERNGITLALLFYGTGAVLGNVLGGIVTDQIGAYRTLLGLAIAQVCVMPVFSLLPIPQPLVFALVLFWPMCGWSFMAAQQLRLLSIAPEAASVVLSLNAAAIYAGAALGGTIGGVILDGHGLSSLGIAGGIAALVAVTHMLISGRVSGR